MRAISSLGQTIIDNNQYKDISPMELVMYTASEVGSLGKLGLTESEIEELEIDVFKMCKELEPFEDNVVMFPKDKSK
jgi:hypothetical protein